MGQQKGCWVWTKFEHIQAGEQVGLAKGPKAAREGKVRVKISNLKAGVGISITT